MKYAVNEEGIAALRRMATAIVAAEEVIYDETGSLKDITDDYDGVLGPHKKSLEGVIENIQISVQGSAGTIKEISELLEEIAEGYQEIMDDNVFSGIGGAGATGSAAGGLTSPQGDGEGSEASSGEKSGSDTLGRMDLAGKTHPVSGVPFDSNGFPIFESKYNTKLEPEDYMKSRSTHFDKASKALYNNIMNDSSLRSKFTKAEIAIFKDGGVPKSYTWHHHQDVGVMQLVDRKLHRKTGHTGGFSIWGPGN